MAEPSAPSLTDKRSSPGALLTVSLPSPILLSLRMTAQSLHLRRTEPRLAISLSHDLVCVSDRDLWCGYDRMFSTYFMIHGAEFPRVTAFETSGKINMQPGHIYSFLWALDLNPGRMSEGKNW